MLNSGKREIGIYSGKDIARWNDEDQLDEQTPDKISMKNLVNSSEVNFSKCGCLGVGGQCREDTALRGV